MAKLREFSFGDAQRGQDLPEQDAVALTTSDGSEGQLGQRLFCSLPQIVLHN